MMAKLHLTKVQKEKVKAWEAQMSKEMQALQKRGGSQEEMSALMDKHIKRFQKILTPAQKKIYDHEARAMGMGG